MITLTAAYALAADDVGEGLDIESLRRELAVREANFKDASFRMVVRDRTRSGLGITKGGAFRDKTQVADVLLDLGQGPVLNGRARAEFLETPALNVQGQPPGPGAEKRIHHLASTTSKDDRTLEIMPDGDMVGYVWKDRGIAWLVPPQEVLGFGYWSPSTWLFRERISPRLDGAEVIDGQETIRVRWDANTLDEAGQAPKGFFRGTSWIAPNRGYAVVRSEIERRPRADAPWKVVSRIDCSQFVQVDGLWIPSRASIIHHTYFDDDLSYELTKEAFVDFSDWKLNRGREGEDYEIDFPEGTIVRDLTRGDVTYRRGAAGDPDIRRQVKRARELSTSVSSPDPEAVDQLTEASRGNPFARSGSGWPLAILLVASAAGLTFFVVRRLVRG